MPGWRFCSSYAERQLAYQGKINRDRDRDPVVTTVTSPVVPPNPIPVATMGPRKVVATKSGVKSRKLTPKSKQVELITSGYLKSRMECPDPPPNSYRDGYVREQKVKFNPIPEILNKDEILAEAELSDSLHRESEYQPQYGGDDADEFENFLAQIGIGRSTAATAVRPGQGQRQGQGQGYGSYGDFPIRIRPEIKVVPKNTYDLDTILQTWTVPRQTPAKFLAGKTGNARKVIPSNFSMPLAPPPADFGPIPPILSVQGIRSSPTHMQSKKSKSQDVIDKYFMDMAAPTPGSGHHRAKSPAAIVDLGGVVKGRQLFPQFRQGQGQGHGRSLP